MAPHIITSGKSKEVNLKVILVDPAFGPDSFNTFGKSHWSSVIHHGLCSISAYAKSKGFTNIELIDLRKLKGWPEYREEVKKKGPAVIGFTMRSCDFNMVMEAAAIVKKVNPATVTLVGGPHPTIAAEEVGRSEHIDHIIIGEGEIAFVELLQAIESGGASDRVMVGTRPNLDELPFDDRELYPDYHVTLKMVNYPGVFKPPMVTFIGQRGCPFRCTYCAPHPQAIFGKKVRSRSVDHVIEELKELRRKYGFRSLKFYDYTFTMNPSWVYEFCEKYQRAGFTAEILAQSRADLICRHPELLKRLRDIGLKLMLVGFESGSQKVLDRLKKGCTVEENLEADHFLKQHGIMVSGSFLLGSPGETREDVQATVDLVKKMRPHFTSVSTFTPIPGCELYDYCREHDLSLIENYDDFVTFAPLKPKIKGIDYEFLSSAINEIMGDRFGGKVTGKLIKWAYLRTKKMLRLRNFLVRCYATWVSSGLYRILQVWRRAEG